MNSFVVSLLSVGLSISALAVDFPEVRGKLHSVVETDLTRVKIVVHASCSDPKTGNCGKEKTEARIEASGAFVIPAMTLDPMGIGAKYEGYFSSGWGKRFNYALSVTGPDGQIALHDLMFWSWEARPGNTLKMMLRDIPLELANLTFYHTTQATKLLLTPGKEFLGNFLKIRLQKQFIPTAAKDTPDVVKGWMSLDLTKAPAKDEVTATLVPVHMLLRGEPSKYGKVPHTRTVVHVYKKITDKKFRFMGLADESAPFHGNGLFAADVVTVHYDPKSAAGGVDE